jgi:hypothetical protein
MSTEISQISQRKFICNYCGIICVRQAEWDRHIVTKKHFSNINCEIGNILSTKKTQQLFKCECSKTYKERTGLWRHKKKCATNNNKNDNNKNDNNIDNDNTNDNTNYNTNDNTNDNITTNANEDVKVNVTNTNNTIMSPKYENDIQQLTNLVFEVVKNNSEFQKQMFDMCKNMQSNIITNYNNTNTNNTFNLQVFLNEHCKDAMNINEFVDSFNLQVSDLENVGRLGYIEGMSNIIINKIKELDVNKRPIHCSDIKREIFYIKDEDKWEREDSNNTKFRKVIKRVSGKNIGMLNAWREIHPDCLDSDSIYNDIYMKLIIAAMGANDIDGNENKIMKKVAKEVVIDKKLYR